MIKYMVCLISLGVLQFNMSYAQDIKVIDGELYELKINSIDNIVLTNTNGKVNNYWLSPNKRYVSYEVIIKYVNEHSDLEDETDLVQVPVCHVVIYDIQKRNIIGEIHPENVTEMFVRIDKWLSDKEILLHDSDGIAVGNSYIYNLEERRLRQID